MRALRMVLVSLVIVLGVSTPGIASVDPLGGSMDPRGQSTGDRFPVVLPRLDCDSTATFAAELIARGFTAEGLPDVFGEALMDPTGRVIVTFQC